MKKALLIVAALALLACIAWQIGSWAMSRVWAEDAVASSTGKPWPGGMGTLDSVAKRFPPMQGNDASRKLAALADRVPTTEALENYVRREIARRDLTIGDPPKVPDVSAIRELLLREPIQWERHGGIAEVGDARTSDLRGSLMIVARTLVASALTKARANDAAAWDDLHAIWNLARSLDSRPEMMLQTASFSMSRMVNAVAWKMPLPSPPWFSDLSERDYVRRFLDAFQYQVASYAEREMFPTKWLAQSVEHDRRIAEEVFKINTCDTNTRMNEVGVDLSFVWQRAFRYRAEREATANAIRIRRGKPIETASRCGNSAWTFDGTTLRLSPDVAASGRDVAMPLILEIKPSWQHS